MMRTAFTDLVGCQVPIQLAPMGAICTPELVGAVAGAGAMGMTSMPGAPARTAAGVLDALGTQVRGPFGFNVLIPFLAGAAGCRMGTRFVVTPESGAHPAYKEAIVRADGDGTVLTDAFRTDWPDTVAEARVSRSSFERNASFPDGATVATVRIGPATLDVPRFGFVPPAAAAEGDIDAMAMYAGESAGLIDAIVPAADMVAHTVRQADDLLRRAAAT